MSIFLRAVINGFGFSLGVALFKRIAAELGLDEKEEKAQPKPTEAAPAADPDLEEMAQTLAGAQL